MLNNGDPKLRSPTRKIETRLHVYPGITESDRLRGNLIVIPRQGFIKELFWDLMLRGPFDSNPPKSALSNEDCGIVTPLDV